MVTNNAIETKLLDSDLAHERHKQLVEAATDLFLRQGFHKTTVRELAQAAGWHMGRLYLYISCKEDVLFLVSQSIVDEVIQELTSIPPQPTATASVRALMQRYLTTVDRLRPQIRLFYRESASMRPDHRKIIEDRTSQILDLITDIVCEGVESGEFRPVDCYLIAHAVVILSVLWAQKEWALAERYTLERYAEEQIELIMARLLPAGS